MSSDSHYGYVPSDSCFELKYDQFILFDKIVSRCDEISNNLWCSLLLYINNVDCGLLSKIYWWIELKGVLFLIYLLKYGL